MYRNSIAGEKVLLLGLEESVALDLARVLQSTHCEVQTAAFGSLEECTRMIEQPGIAVVFCSAERQPYSLLLGIIGQRGRRLPVIIVSRSADTSGWLDAIEAGAADYCSPPFEPAQLQWILDNTLENRSRSAVA